MYLIINETKHTVSKRIKTTDTIKYLSVEPAPENISGNIQMFRDDGFLMCEDNADDYARKSYSGTLLTMTNAPEPTPVPVPEDDTVTWDIMAAAITEGVNEV